jgi:hypothetical protein
MYVATQFPTPLPLADCLIHDRQGSSYVIGKAVVAEDEDWNF